MWLTQKKNKNQEHFIMHLFFCFYNRDCRHLLLEKKKKMKIIQHVQVAEVYNCDDTVWWYHCNYDLQTFINFARANFIWDALRVTIFSAVCAQLCSGEDQWVGWGDKKTSVQSLTPPAMVFKIVPKRNQVILLLPLVQPTQTNPLV